MIGSVEFDVLAELDDGDSVADLAGKLDRSESYVSRAVSDLEGAGLVSTSRGTRPKRIHRSDSRAVELYLNLVRQHPHVAFSELLTEATLEVLYHFDEPSSVAELAERSGNYRNTVNRILQRLQHRGLVRNEGGTYRFNDDFGTLHEFARELVHHFHRHQLRSVASRGTIVWESYDEFLAQTESDVDAEHYFETGLARFAEYGLQFLVTSRRYYFYSTGIDELSPADLCCHTLLIDDGTRHRSYCLLLLAATDVEEERLGERAEKYGLTAEVDAMVTYLRSDGEVDADRLPEWSEFEDLAADYGVNL